MLVAKPHKQGSVHALDGSDKSVEIQNLASLPGSEDLIQAVDGLPFNNPDGAMGAMGSKPGLMQVQSPGKIRSENVSGKGVVHKTGVTSAPMSNPFPAAKNTAK